MATRRMIVRNLEKSVQASETVVKGEIPSWLNGILFRNGPGRFDFGNKSYDHLFDGQACVHKFTIKNGQVKYANKLLESMAYKKTVQNNRLYPAFGTASTDSSLFERISNLISSHDHMDNTNVAVAPYNKDHLYAMTEVTRISRLDPSDLSIMNTVNLSKYLPDVKSMVAHPHVEKDGSWINCGTSSIKGKVYYTIVKYKVGNGQNLCEHAEVLANIPSTHSNGFGYFHSFAVTDNYVILLESPLKICLKTIIMSMIKNKPFSSALTMDKLFPTKIYVVNKHTGKILPQKFVTDPQFTFHHMNAYEVVESDNNSRLMVDISSYDSETFDIQSLKGNARDEYKNSAYAKRIEIPINLKEKSTDEVYCTLKNLNPKFAFEAPMINYARNNGKDYQYVYGMNLNFNTPHSIIKMDIKNPLNVLEQYYGNGKEHMWPAEPVFVPSPNAESEDDGVLVTMVMNENGNDFLSILDAKDLKELARAVMPENVKGSFTFHGFFADNQTHSSLNQ